MADPVHILITGGAGQVGLELQAAAWPEGVVLHAPTRAELDLGDAASVRAAFAATPFAAVINSGAHTAVDKAEAEVAASVRRRFVLSASERSGGKAPSAPSGGSPRSVHSTRSRRVTPRGIGPGCTG